MTVSRRVEGELDRILKEGTYRRFSVEIPGKFTADGIKPVKRGDKKFCIYAVDELSYMGLIHIWEEQQEALARCKEKLKKAQRNLHAE